MPGGIIILTYETKIAEMKLSEPYKNDFQFSKKNIANFEKIPEFFENPIFRFSREISIKNRKIHVSKIHFENFELVKIDGFWTGPQNRKTENSSLKLPGEWFKRVRWCSNFVKLQYSPVL